MRRLEGRVRRLEDIKKVGNDGVIAFFIDGYCEVNGERLTVEEFNAKYPNEEDNVVIEIYRMDASDRGLDNQKPKINVSMPDNGREDYFSYSKDNHPIIIKSEDNKRGK